MAKKKKAPKKTGVAALKLTTGRGNEPTFSTAATVCISVALYNIRERANELAIKRACKENPVPKEAMVLALAELGLNWAVETE